MKLDPILVVEDDPRDVELLMETLKGCNLANEIIVLRDGQEALNFLNRHGAYQDRGETNPAIVFLDIKLPNVSGIDVLRQIKKVTGLQDTPVVMLTCFKQETHQVSSFQWTPIRENAFIKSMRGSDPDATLYWLAKLIHAGEDPRFIARRIMIHATEDVGLADNTALQTAVAALHAVQHIG
jgi:putative ATPase